VSASIFNLLQKVVWTEEDKEIIVLYRYVDGKGILNLNKLFRAGGVAEVVKKSGRTP
jgi:hypothetical protein